MERLSLLFNNKRRKERKADKESRIQKIINGYPVTNIPFVPEILKQAVDFKKYKGHDDYQRVGLTLAPEGSNLVDSKSLEMIRKRLLVRFGGYQTIKNKFESPLPRNTIAISFSELHFEVGKSCQEFSLKSNIPSMNGGFYTHQKLSENLQATYYTENGTKFLAGICYYPVPNGRVLLLSNDRCLIGHAQTLLEEWPLHDRRKDYRMVKYRVYGRYCGKAGKRVVVDCSGLRGGICHKEFDHFSRKWAFPICEECSEDFTTYKFEKPEKSTPPIPVATEALQKEQTVKTLEELNNLRIRELQLVNTNKDGTPQFEETVSVFNRKTGELLETSKCPKITELSAWLDANLDYNVHFNSALLAHLLLESAYKDRIGGNKEYTSVLSTSVSSLTASSVDTNESECEHSITTDAKMSSEDLVNFPKSLNVEEDNEASTSLESSDSPSPATSTESLLDDYDEIKEANGHDNEFDMEMIN